MRYNLQVEIYSFLTRDIVACYRLFVYVKVLRVVSTHRLTPAACCSCMGKVSESILKMFLAEVSSERKSLYLGCREERSSGEW